VDFPLVQIELILLGVIWLRRYERK